MIGGNLNVLTLTTLPPALYALLARSEHCLEALQAQDDGKFQPVGENWFYTIAVAHTAPAETRHTEFHRQYLDIQIVLEGTEIIDFSWIDAHQQQAEEKNDPFIIAQARLPHSVHLKVGDFVIFYPGEAHQCVKRYLKFRWPCWRHDNESSCAGYRCQLRDWGCHCCTPAC
ncbi:hypothetical protein ETR_06190 [Erwinia tracheiphila PSU-1]|uniref:YhcH/YjgK/YiaL family protein n=1 Tax=Erwinia tracheiphila TaxID=65700 RepID=UPI000337FAF8|nr:YhcH/YjgK/YiaL family protein [Erwinia tracheiphila]EOS95828.1 hypothetical protein ETR_06190 [Erwinia tracheiphila PSU-1]